MKGLALIAIGCALAGCAPTEKELFVRADGQPTIGNPVLTQQFDLDRAACLGQAQQARIAGVTFASGTIAGAVAQGQRDAAAVDVGKGCMADRGYMSVPESQADQKLAENARVAALRTASAKAGPPSARR